MYTQRYNVIHSPSQTTVYSQQIVLPTTTLAGFPIELTFYHIEPSCHAGPCFF